MSRPLAELGLSRHGLLDLAAIDLALVDAHGDGRFLLLECCHLTRLTTLGH